MAIQFSIHFIECVHLLHPSTAEEGWLCRTSSESWNFYLTHQLNEAYVDTVGGRLGGAASYF
jgi:hypothetical protein